MAFKSVQVDRHSWRVLDEERGIELKQIGGSSSGTLWFRLSSKVDEKRISGKLSSQLIAPGEPTSSGAKAKMCWHLPSVAPDAIFRFGPAESEVVSLKEVLIGAFEQHQATGRPLEGYIVEIEFQ